MLKFIGLVLTTMFCMCFMVTKIAAQQNAQFIYGVVTTKSDEKYEGFMRWGKEEITWHDSFNSTKSGNQSRKNSDKRGSSLWGEFDWSITSLWKDKYQGSNHTFACQFGDIAILHNKGGDRVDVELKNGSIIKVDGGSNDIGATVRMKDYELGLIKFDWKRIKNVEFFQAPTNRNPKYGTLLYGVVKTRRGREYRGFIKWDDDERMGDDILDGDSRNGEQKIPFENIVAIEKERNGSMITFKSGREISLDGSNDVDDGNRGVIVYQEGVGTIDVPWKYFRKVEFEQPPVGPVYRDYVNPQALEGHVTLYDGEIIEGQIIFDRDEMWDLEVLDGNDDDLHFEIPFRNIKRIVPKNSSYSMIYLRNGDELLLGDTQDVSDDNDGIFIFNNKNKPTAINWDDIDDIVFK